MDEDLLTIFLLMVVIYLNDHTLIQYVYIHLVLSLVIPYKLMVFVFHYHFFV